MSFSSTSWRTLSPWLFAEGSLKLSSLSWCQGRGIGFSWLPLKYGYGSGWVGFLQPASLTGTCQRSCSTCCASRKCIQEPHDSINPTAEIAEGWCKWWGFLYRDPPPPSFPSHKSLSSVLKQEPCAELTAGRCSTALWNDELQQHEVQQWLLSALCSFSYVSEQQKEKLTYCKRVTTRRKAHGSLLILTLPQLEFPVAGGSFNLWTPFCCGLLYLHCLYSIMKRWMGMSWDEALQ